MRTLQVGAAPFPSVPACLPCASVEDFPDPLALGDPALLGRPRLALFCSNRCPGGLILAAQDLAHALRGGQQAIAGGFHTPVEWECLRILLGGSAPLIICPARGLEGMRVPVAWRGPLADGRLLLLSPFDGKLDRPTQKLSSERNRFVAALADEALFIHATPGGKAEALARALIAEARPVYALPDPANTALIASGARVWGGCPILT